MAGQDIGKKCERCDSLQRTRVLQFDPFISKEVTGFRCSRLRKECIFPTSIAHKRKPRKKTYVAKQLLAAFHWNYWITSSHRQVSEMEAKIDGLVTLLKSTQQPSLNNQPVGFLPDPSLNRISHAPPTPSPIGGPYPSLHSTRLGDGEKQSPLVPALIQDGLSSIRVANSRMHRTSESSPPFGIKSNPEEAEVLLNRFRQMTPYFPFIVLPASITARNLLRERPFLYHCIMAVSCQSPQRQIAFGEEMMQYLGEQMLVKGEKSIDLLLGILTYAGWFVPLVAFSFPQDVPA
jgi:hypothetical protein